MINMLISLKICGNPKLANTARSQTLRRLTMRGFDSAQANTARSFAGTIFFFAGLNLP